MTRHVVVIGDAILDRTVEGTSERLAPDAPVPVIDVADTLETPGGAARSRSSPPSGTIRPAAGSLRC